MAVLTPTAVGTDVRKLAYDGHPASHILGCDLREEYIELGYTLFRDKDTCPIRFFTSDVFDLPTSPPAPKLREAKPLDVTTISDLSQLYDSLTHIYTGALFHLFDKENQYGLAIRLARLLKREPGAVIFGRHQGLESEGYIDDHLGRYCDPDELWHACTHFAIAPGTDMGTRRVHGPPCGRLSSPR